MELSLRIRDIRKERGLTIAQLAELVGVSTPHMSEVERGKKNLNNHLLMRLSDALGVAPYELIRPERDELSRLEVLLSKLSEEDRKRVETFAENLARSK